VLRGGDTEALRHYLQTVQELKPTKFEVQWNPATVAIDREAAIRSLRSVSRNGATFVFAASEPEVMKLKPGSILRVRDLALRKVDAVNTEGGLTTVHTAVVSLNEAMPNADIEFEASVPVQNFLLSRPEPAPEPAVKTAAHKCSIRQSKAVRCDVISRHEVRVYARANSDVTARGRHHSPALLAALASRISLLLLAALAPVCAATDQH